MWYEEYGILYGELLSSASGSGPVVCFKLAMTKLQCPNTRQILKILIIFFVQLIIYALKMYLVEMEEKLRGAGKVT
jgi:hypothetical protein